MPRDAPEQVVEIPLRAIFPNPRQPRRRFSRERLERLARSIEGQGVIQPLVVRPHPVLEGRFELIAGERRLRAIRLLGRAVAPALVRELPDRDLLEVALVENLHRDPLTPIEEAQAYSDLLREHGYTQQSLSDRVGRDRSTIANMVRLLALPASIQRDLEEERLAVGHARALLGLSDPKGQARLRDRIVANGLSVREAERLAARPPGPAGAGKSPPPGPPAREEPRLAALRETLENRLGTRVAINGGITGRGKIEIDYYSAEDLGRLCDLLLGR